MKRWKKFQGTATALVTPFKHNRALDEPALRRLVERQIRGGVEAIVPVGTTGESPTLTDDEKRRIISIVLETANGRVQVFAGTGSNDTHHAIAMTKFAKDAGADGVLLVAPYYNKPTQEGYFQHYRAIAESVEIPFIVYNVPGRTGGNIDASTTLRIAEELPNAAMVKEASGNMAQIMEIAKHKPAHFSLVSGDDALTLPMMSVGADGCISVVANQIPKEFSDLVRCCLKGKWEKARATHERLLDVMNVNFVESNPIPVKTSLAMMGLIEESFRLPLVPISPKNREKLAGILRNLKLIP